jgi:hypothetical protein
LGSLGPSRRSSIHRASPVLQDMEDGPAAFPPTDTAFNAQATEPTASPCSSRAGLGVTSADRTAAAAAVIGVGSVHSDSAAASERADALASHCGHSSDVDAVQPAPVHALDKVDRLFDRESKILKVLCRQRECYPLLCALCFQPNLTPTSGIRLVVATPSAPPSPLHTMISSFVTAGRRKRFVQFATHERAYGDFVAESRVVCVSFSGAVPALC